MNMPNFAEQRKIAAKRSSQVQHSDKLPSQKGYGMVSTQYQGENYSQTLDIIDSGAKGTVVNKPNEAYTREAGTPVFLIQEDKKKIGK